MRTTILLYLILIASTSEAQINLDSLRHQLETSNNWTKTKTVDYLMQNFQRFESKDNAEIYDLYIDSAGNLNEYIGLATVYKKYDQQKRITKIIGYNLKGNYSFWDFSPIQLTEYHNDTTIIDDYNSQYLLTGRKISVKDSKDRIIEEQHYDKSLKLYSRVVYDYFDLQNILLQKNYDGNGILKPNKKGVAIKLQIFDNKKHIIEERFYDSQMNLIDANHDFEDDTPCKYSILKRKITKKLERTFYYNSKNELQCESDGFSIMTWQTAK